MAEQKSRNTFAWIVLLFILLVRSSTILGLNPNTSLDKYIHHIWTTRDGLPQNTIHSITQDNSGYMWLGTDRGLVRFDGSLFKTFDKTNTPAIKNNSITSLLMTKKGTLWIGTYGGGITSYKNRRFKNYSNKNGLPNHFITALAEDHHENLWIGTTGGGLIRFNGKTFTAFTDAEGLSYNIVTSLFRDSKGILWIGTEKGLNCLKDDKIISYPENHNLANSSINTIIEDSKGYLRIGTANGLLCIRNRPPDLKKGNCTTFTRENGLVDNFISAVKEDKDGSLWIATNGGLNRMRTADKKIEIHGFTSKDGLSDNALTSLYEDKWGNVWVGTSGGGLNVFKEGEFTFYTIKDGLSSNYIKAIYEDDAGTLWIGTNGGGLNSFKKGKFNAYSKKDGLSSNYVDSLCSDSEGNLWIGTTNGLNRFKNRKFDIFTMEDGLPNNSIRSLFRDSKGNLWIGTFGGGLSRYKEGRFHTLDTTEGVPDNFVLALAEDKYGNLWIGTNSGVSCFDGNLFRRFSRGENAPRGMVQDIYCDAEGSVWIAAGDDGLIRWKDGLFTRFKTDEVLSGSVIYRIIEDPRENLWMSSARGIFSVSRRQLNRYADSESKQHFINWRHFQEDDGLKTSVCTGGFQPAGWKSKNGMIWFPTIKGIAAVDFGKTIFSVQEPVGISEMPGDIARGFSYVTVIREEPAIIEKIVADGRPVTLHDPFKLPPGTKKIEFHFIALNYRTPGKTLFKYRLWGYDRKWQKSRKNSAVYQGVPAGRYRFIVFARSSDENWTFEGDSYSFFIRFPFHQTFWFYFLLTLGLVFLVFAVPYLLEIRAKRKRVREEKYRGSTLTDQKSKMYLNRLLKIMAEEKPYLDASLSLQKLAQQMDITKEDLSQVINEQLGRNFKHLINEYRIEEAKRKLEDPRENQFVILKIAFDAGFNSKSVFNASFKKYTGLSPSEYRKKYQKNMASGRGKQSEKAK